MGSVRESVEPAVVLLSGGLDSAVALAVARQLGHDCHALSFDYGQRHRVELNAASTVSRSLGAASHRVVAIDLRAIGGSALTDSIEVPKSGPRAGAPGDIPVTYVPARNMVFLSIAAGLAEVVGARDIFIGVNAIDYSGYPDCRRPFIDAVEHAAALGTKAGVEGRAVRIRTPLVELSKADIIRLGARLGVDFSLTSSCYDPDADERACGACDSCRLRAAGFREARVPDPTRYRRA